MPAPKDNGPSSEELLAMIQALETELSSVQTQLAQVSDVAYRADSTSAFNRNRILSNDSDISNLFSDVAGISSATDGLQSQLSQLGTVAYRADFNAIVNKNDIGELRYDITLLQGDVAGISSVVFG